MTKTFVVSVVIDVDICVEAENETEARELAQNEAYGLGDVSNVDIMNVEEADD